MYNGKWAAASNNRNWTLGIYTPISSSSLTLMPLPSQLRVLAQGDSSVVEEYPLPHSLHRLPPLPQLQFTGLPAPGPDAISLSKYYSQIACALRSFVPPSCRWLRQEDVELTGGYPIAAGGFADVWEAIHDGRKVALKSYRCYTTFDVTRAAGVR
jgi:hypothetical protein